MGQPATISNKDFAAAIDVEIAVSGRGSFTVNTSDVYRPGMQCTGYFRHFMNTRIQLFGNAEMTYLSELPEGVVRERMEAYFSYDIPAVCVARGYEPLPVMKELAQKRGVPIFTSKLGTTRLSHRIVSFLDERTSPCVTRHGGLLDINGVGVMLTGESGIGKSETALELVKRGHRLVADDVIEIRKVGDGVLSGSAPELVRYLMELRGIGIIDVRSLYGVGSVMHSKQIDLVVKLEDWNDQKEYDRLGVSYDTISILGVSLPSILLPVRPGRNLAIIVEVAAMNYRLKRMGYDAAVEFDRRLLEHMNS
ncbi:MAG: HPr(Ser) kinase/phosphatase [Christensenellales bacterium]|jgi:HPr kinase/phosphorylase